MKTTNSSTESQKPGPDTETNRTSASLILDNLKTSGVQQAHKEGHIAFTGISPWPGDLVCAEGTYIKGDADSGAEKRAGIFIGPEFGTVSRPDLVAAAREAADGRLRRPDRLRLQLRRPRLGFQ